MLTARGDDVDRIVGLEMGADDYLPKPFNPRELVARIRAVLRRVEATVRAEPELITVGDVVLDTGARTAHRDGEEIRLTAVEFDVLEQLVRNAGVVVSREKLTRDVLDREYSALDRSIDMHVSNLRRKLGTEYAGVERIKTIRGVGYVYTRRAISEEPSSDSAVASAGR
jgi:two-component system response regulator CpxR